MVRPFACERPLTFQAGAALRLQFNFNIYLHLQWILVIMAYALFRSVNLVKALLYDNETSSF
jgi:hypothetical protein